jgi:manganese transport protein
MYNKILVALENSTSDAPLLEHVRKLARLAGAECLLVHVADGWAARNYEQLKLAESEEMRADKAYLREKTEALRNEGLRVEWELAMGNPPEEILRVARERGCDLIALATHGHKVVGDVVYGSTISKVRHNTTIPLLVVYGGKPGAV